jgi:hypothetical protein
MNKLILTLVVALMTSTAMADRGSTYYHNGKVYSYSSQALPLDDQSRCQAEADYMARNNITGHVWGTIGNFEGVGYGNSSQCNTCVPSSRYMRLTGDASSQGRNGMWYRVRSWR